MLAARSLRRADRLAGTIIALGLLVRAVAGLTLFWISYLHLPLGRSLQTAKGYWFFALDGQFYHLTASRLASEGLAAILAAPATLSSVSYVQSLALFLWVTGSGAAGGVLFNLIMYLVTASIIVWWAARVPSGRRAALFALAACALSPSAILWTTQSLKDPFFHGLVAVFFMAAVVWHGAWREQRLRIGHLAGGWLLLALAIFAMAGIRWYYALAMLGGAAAFLVHSAVGAQRWRVAIPVSALALLALSRAFLLGASPSIPSAVRAALSPWEQQVSLAGLSGWLLHEVDARRDRFVRSGGATAFGADIEPADSSPATGSPTAPALPPSTSSTTAPATVPPAATEYVALGLDVRQVWIAHGAAGPGQRLALAVNRVRPGGTADVAGVRPDDVLVAIDAHPVANVAELRQRAREMRPDTALTIDLIRDGQPRTVQVRRNRLGGRARNSAAPTERAFSLPPGLVSPPRWRAGMLMMFIPTSLQRLFGTSVVSGGRGLLALTDIDTLFFDAVLVIAFATTVGHRRSYHNSVFVLALLLTLVIALPMIYTVTNFGTLFRLRGMVLGTAALLPLAARRRRQDAQTGASPLTTR